MPKEVDLPLFLAKLRKADPDGYTTHSLKLPVKLAARVAEACLDDNVNLTVGIRRMLDELLRAKEAGVVTAFDPALLDRLNLAATHLGLDRESLVRLIVAEHCGEYLEKALAGLTAQKGLEAKIKAAAKK